jgi:hypothetical protein
VGGNQTTNVSLDESSREIDHGREAWQESSTYNLKHGSTEVALLQTNLEHFDALLSDDVCELSKND